MQVCKWDLRIPKIHIQLARREARYLVIVAVIILFVSDASCPRCRSRLKPKIDVEGKIKVVKFLVSINARRVHISAYVAFAAYVSVVEVLSFRPVFKPRASRGRLFPRCENNPLAVHFSKSIDTEPEFICSFYSWCYPRKLLCVYIRI